MSVGFDLVHFGAITDKTKNALIDACKKGKIQKLTKTLGQITSTDDNKDLKRIIDEEQLLIRVCDEGYGDCLDELLKKKPNLDVRTKEGDTPLMVACIKGNAPCVKSLLKARADLNAKNHIGMTALMMVCLDNHLSCLDLLLAEKSHSVELAEKSHSVELDVADDEGATALITACIRGHAECVEKLADAGADLNKVMQRDGTRDGTTPLMHACWAKQPSCVEKLLDRDNGADVHKEDSDKFTALHYACSYGCHLCIFALHRHGANMAPRNYWGETPLMKTVLLEKQNCLVAMIALSAETIDEPNHREGNFTALMYACTHGYLDSTRRLIKAGANIEARGGQDEKTPLMLAASLGNKAIVRELITNNAELNATDNKKCTAVISCCMHGRDGCLEELIQAGADLDIKADDQTALMRGIIHRHNNCSKMLIDAQNTSSLNARDQQGMTALTFACMRLNLPIVEALLAKGASIGDGSIARMMIEGAVNAAAEQNNDAARETGEKISRMVELAVEKERAMSSSEFDAEVVVSPSSESVPTSEPAGPTTLHSADQDTTDSSAPTRPTRGPKSKRALRI